MNLIGMHGDWWIIVVGITLLVAFNVLLIDPKKI